jgi:hypothetical protein
MLAAMPATSTTRAARGAILCLVAACGGTPGSPDTAPAAVEPRAETETGATGDGEYPAGLTEIGAELAPVPFPPGSLARGLSAGTTMTYRVETAGESPFLQTTEFVEVDAEGTAMRETQTELDGAPRGEPRTARARWSELESHAHFPRPKTTITTAAIEVPAGRFAGYRYEIRGEGTARTRLWFARELPGPPVRVIREVDGRPVLEMTLVATERPATPLAPTAPR